MDKKEITSFPIDGLVSEIAALGEKPFRARQIYSWLHEKLAESFEEMTDISKGLRQKLEAEYRMSQCILLESLVSNGDGAIKYLFQLQKNTIIESVLMRHSYGNTVCVSTQAGCRMGCRFCASTQNGIDRNLTAGEMLWQVYRIQKLTGERVAGVVLMGSGEPLDNYKNALEFIEILSSEAGLNIGQRHITLSTCGLVDQIIDLADRKLQITLAVSLHAPNDEIRKKTMPIANKYAMETLLNACKYYADATGRRVTYEYALIQGQNDSRENAQELGKRLKGTLSHVNIIPVNDTVGKFGSPGEAKIAAFADTLRKFGVETTVRRSLGSSINAACGQLRGNYSRGDKNARIWIDTQRAAEE